MKVYVVMYHNPWEEANWLEGVFSTREKAEKGILDMIEFYAKEEDREERKEYYHISEWTLDE